MTSATKTIIWRIVDGKPGHEKQTQGLATALAAVCACDVITIKAKPWYKNLSDLVTRSPLTHQPEAPALVLGAGHQTHWSLLKAKHDTGASTIVLMQPGLPNRWFDLCLIPRHDGANESRHVMLTDGVINTQKQPQQKVKQAGVILVGGPSRHFDWDTSSVLSQIDSVLQSGPGHRWEIYNSRRTPATMRKDLVAFAGQNVTFIDRDDSRAGQLDESLNRSAVAWVTADSFSMIYEALTAGCQTGVFMPGTARRTRQSLSLHRLGEQRLLRFYADWVNDKKLVTPAVSLNEAERCADYIVHRFLTGNKP